MSISTWINVSFVFERKLGYSEHRNYLNSDRKDYKQNDIGDGTDTRELLFHKYPEGSPFFLVSTSKRPTRG